MFVIASWCSICTMTRISSLARCEVGGRVGLERQREAAGAQRARALRRVLAAAHQQLGLRPGPDVGRQHAPRAGVEHALDVLLAQRGHAHERRARVAGDGGEHRGQRRHVDGAVLGVDEQPVEAHRGHHLGHQGIAEVQETAEGRAAAPDALLDVVGRHRRLRSIARRCGSLGAMLNGKTGIVFGVANKRSIAWAIAQALSREGMRLAFTYQGERLKENVEELAATHAGLARSCRATSPVDAEIDAVFASVGDEFGRLDALVHSVAFAPQRRSRERLREHLARGLQDRARHLRLLAGRR